MKKRIVSLFLALVMALSLIPTTVWAEVAEGSESSLGSVRVIVENTTYTEVESADLKGTLVDADVPLTADATMMSCVASALSTAGYTAVGAESGYISEIKKGEASLAEIDGGSGSGWMGTLNDWLTNRGFKEFTVADGTLANGDEIRVMYTCNLGADIGGNWTTMNDTSLTALSFSAGKLAPEFDKDTTSYTLELTEDVEQVTVAASAANKQNQVYLSVGETSYRRTASIPVANGTVLTIRCGDAQEASGEGENATPAVTPTTYTVTMIAPHAPVVTTAEVTIRSQAAGAYLHGFAEKQTVASDLAEKYGFTDEVDGVSALDVLVRAHELIFGKDFTKETAATYLVVGSTGFITTIFGEKTGNCGFTINGSVPHDGVLKDDSYAPGKKSYTGYTVAQAEVNTGNVVDFFLYQDDYASDNYPIWKKADTKLDSLTVKPKAAVNMTVMGYCIGYYGCVPMEALEDLEQVSALESAQLAWVDAKDGTLTDISGAVVAEDGTVSFTAPETDGTYYLTAYMPKAEIKDNYATPIVLSILPVTVDVNAVEEAELTLSGIHDAQVKYLKLYTYTNSTKGDTDLLADVTIANAAYTLTLPVGDYWVEGYDANDDCNGGLSLTVKAGENAAKIQRIYQISVNSDWVLGTDYTLDVKVTSADNQVRAAAPGRTVSGKGQSWEKTYDSCIFVVGDTVQATVTPDPVARPTFNTATAKKTPTMNDSLSVSCKAGVNVTFSVPENSTVTMGTLTKYYVYSFIEPVSRDAEANTVTYRVDQNTDYFYRVQNPDGVTYWNYKRWSADDAITLTAEDLHIGDTSFTKDTIYRFEKNQYDRADIYLNINTQGYKSMAVGETFELNSFRNWFAIESISNAKVALPDMHYQVIDANGNPSDVVTIVPDAQNSNVAVMTANKAGTAIVLVTYDAMTYMQGMTTTAANREFSAIWPECTGVFVVTVGSDGTGIKTNMTLDRMDAVIEKDEARQLDAEHDILFYLGNEGASYSFKPEDGCTVTVARSTVGDEMTFNGFTNSGVTVAEDGTVTVTGLTTGRHIIKVEKNGAANYQVVTARGVSYKLVDNDGKELTEAAKAALKAGDTVNLQFSNLVSPKEKLSGAYNFNFSLYYKGEDGTFFKSNPGSNWGVYDFSGNPARQFISITIPKYWDGETYSLAGAIKQAGWPGVPTHRGITYAKGAERGFNAPTVSGILARLPELTLKLAKTDFLTGKLSFVGSDGKAIARTALTITLKDAAGNTVNVADNGSFKCYAEEYFYTISGQGVEYTTGSVTVTEGGTNQFSVTLAVTSDTAWDGSSKTEPQKNESGVYQIATGAELAWFVNESKTADVSGVLTADIKLGKYAWLNIDSSKKVELDGAGHEITGLNATSGLFRQIGGSSHIQNLTLRGTMTCASSTSGGSVVGYANGKNIVIENCFSYVTVTGTGRNVGGIVGYANSTTTIRNCANLGAVTSDSNVGGIIGGFVGSGAVITGCYNTGAVTATASNAGAVTATASNAGGIFGNGNYGITVTNCYNTGAVSANSNAGGIGGVLKGEMNWTGTLVATATVSDCYSVGAVTGGNGAFGSVDAGSATVTSCYALAADANAAVLTEEQMKSAELNTEAFGLACGGYPALKWQKDVTFHKAEGGTVVPPTCTEKGYTLRTCTLCRESYRDTYVAATGHTERAGTKTVYPAYYTYTCDVCEELITVWADTRLEYVTLPATGVVSAAMTDEGKYPWTYNSAAERFESGNAGANSSTSTTSFVFTLDRQRTIAFDFGVSSEEKYDKATITLSNGTETNTVASGISGTKADTYNGILTAGTWTLTVTYVKDDGGNKGADMAYVSGLTIADTAPAAAAEGAEAGVTLRDEYTIDLAAIFTDADGDELTYAVSINGAAPVAAEASYRYTAVLVGTTTLVFTASDGEKTSAPYTVTLTVAKPAGPDVQEAYKTTGDYLSGKGTPIVGSIGGEWMTIGLARSGRTVPEGYYDNAVAYVKAKINTTTNRLDRNKSTDNARLILALTAIGKDVTDVGGFDLLAGLDDMKYVKRQGTNGPVWTLIALDSHDYTPAGSVTRDALVETILSLQKDGGAWYINSTNTTDDVDMTAMAIQALAPYYKTNEAVKAAVDKALTWLSTMQKSDGSFAEMAGAASSSESTAQVLVALCALGIDPTADARFAKNSFHVLDGLLTFYTGEAFKHQIADTTVDQMATEQSYYALAAYMRLTGSQNFLYDMTDVCIKHVFGEWTVTKAATCTEAGISTRTCTVCGAEETLTVPALGHKFGEWTETKAATCTEPGVSTRTCTVCGEAKETKDIPALGHKFGEWTETKAATCTEPGVSTRTCTVCGEAKETKDIPALGHKFGEWTETKAATCTETGVSTRTCTVCGEAKETKDIPALGHKFGEWTETKAATCTETGVSTRTCTVCGEAKETKDIPALGHKAGTTYFMDKDSHWLTCTVCGAVLTKGAHTYVQGVQCVCGLMRTSDSTVKKVEVKADVSSVVADNDKLNTPEKVKSTLQLEIGRTNNAITEKNTVMMEVTLTVTENGVSRPATKDDLTGGRITVLLPYPSEVAGDYRSYAFTVAHLVTMAGCGKDVGTVEFPAAVMTENGLLVTLTGLSPVAISYTERSSSGGGSGGSGSITVVKPTSSNTADDSQMTIWMGSALLAAAAVVVLTQKKKRVSK